MKTAAHFPDHFAFGLVHSKTLRDSLLALICALIFIVTAPCAFSDTTCREKIVSQFHARVNEQNSAYLRIGGVPISPGNEPVLKIADERADRGAVLVAHGFLASPFEVHALVDRLFAEGYTVYAPLVFGFGASTEMANQATLPEFRRSIADGVALLKTCYPSVSMVGMSWGGALAADYVLNQPGGSNSVQSLTLISPYFKAKAPFAREINGYSARYVDVLPLWVAELLSPNDMRATRLFPEHYLPSLPLNAVNVALAFSDQLKDMDREKEDLGRKVSVDVPTFLAVSMDDETVDPTYALQFVKDHFTRSWSFVYPKSLRIPHQIPLPEINPNYSEFESWWLKKFDSIESFD